MNKELTPLQAFENIIVDLTPHLKNANTEEIKIVETALRNQFNLELENRTLQMNLDLGAVLAKGLQERLDENKKKLKALEIIKNKRVDTQLLKDSKNLNDYNWCVHTKDRALTKEEYELLKEVLINE